jgi:1,4-alpha-glucan branching enzyme
MNDTLEYISRDPIHRRYHQGELTFSMIYAFTENFLLPFSHDEVVHGKGSMLNKMPGDEWQRFANLRLLYTYMFTHPGKKLMFMGTEFGQGTEWDATGVLDWYVLGYAFHEKLQRLVKALNRLYAEQRPLHQYDFDSRGFEWIDYHDVENSVLVYQRKSDDEFLVIALNLTPTPRTGYRIGVPKAGAYHELLNSDTDYFGGSNVVNASGSIMAEENPWMNHPYSLTVTLPPLAGIILKPGELPTGSRVENPIAAIGKSSAVEPKPTSKPKINAGDSGKQPTP